MSIRVATTSNQPSTKLTQDNSVKQRPSKENIQTKTQPHTLFALLKNNSKNREDINYIFNNLSATQLESTLPKMFAYAKDGENQAAKDIFKALNPANQEKALASIGKEYIQNPNLLKSIYAMLGYTDATMLREKKTLDDMFNGLKDEGIRNLFNMPQNPVTQNASAHFTYLSTQNQAKTLNALSSEPENLFKLLNSMDNHSYVDTLKGLPPNVKNKIYTSLSSQQVLLLLNRSTPEQINIIFNALNQENQIKVIQTLSHQPETLLKLFLGQDNNKKEIILAALCKKPEDLLHLLKLLNNQTGLQALNSLSATIKNQIYESLSNDQILSILSHYSLQQVSESFMALNNNKQIELIRLLKDKNPKLLEQVFQQIKSDSKFHMAENVSAQMWDYTMNEKITSKILMEQRRDVDYYINRYSDEKIIKVFKDYTPKQDSDVFLLLSKENKRKSINALSKNPEVLLKLLLSLDSAHREKIILALCNRSEALFALLNTMDNTTINKIMNSLSESTKNKIYSSLSNEQISGLLSKNTPEQNAKLFLALNTTNQEKIVEALSGTPENLFKLINSLDKKSLEALGKNSIKIIYSSLSNEQISTLLGKNTAEQNWNIFISLNYSTLEKIKNNEALIGILNKKLGKDKMNEWALKDILLNVSEVAKDTIINALTINPEIAKARFLTMDQWVLKDILLTVLDNTKDKIISTLTTDDSTIISRFKDLDRWAIKEIFNKCSAEIKEKIRTSPLECHFWINVDILLGNQFDFSGVVSHS